MLLIFIMDLNIIITVLSLCIVGCIIAIIIFAIIDIKKEKEQAKEDVNNNNNKGVSAKTATSLFDFSEDSVSLEDKVIAAANKEVTVKEQKDITEVKDGSTNTDNAEQPLNPMPVNKSITQTTENNSEYLPAVGINSELANSTLILLQSIADELKHRANKSDNVIVNYLKEDASKVSIQNGYFMTRNEELIINGEFLDDAESWYIPANSRINIRFCLNIVVPDGYTMFVEPIADLLLDKGLEVKHITIPDNDSMSIRVDLTNSAHCTIRKSECLFKIKVMKEVAQ